ncbi:hypothetical protein ACOSP7_023559 [Xanthoceras sorbifolium]
MFDSLLVQLWWERGSLIVTSSVYMGVRWQGGRIKIFDCCNALMELLAWETSQVEKENAFLELLAWKNISG